MSMLVHSIQSAKQAISHSISSVARTPYVGKPLVGAVGLTGGVGLLTGLKSLGGYLSGVVGGSSLIKSSSGWLGEALGAVIKPVGEFAGNVLGFPMIAGITPLVTLSLGGVGGALWALAKANKLREAAISKAVQATLPKRALDPLSRSLNRVI